MMSKRSAIEVKGSAQLARTLRKAGADMKDLRAVNRKAAASIIPTARAETPIRSGRLQQSVRAGATQKAGVLRAGKASVPYAGPIHWGWRDHHIQPHPFLVDAARQTEPTWVGIYESEIKKLLEQVQGA